VLCTYRIQKRIGLGADLRVRRAEGRPETAAKGSASPARGGREDPLTGGGRPRLTAVPFTIRGAIPSQSLTSIAPQGLDQLCSNYKELFMQSVRIININTSISIDLPFSLILLSLVPHASRPCVSVHFSSAPTLTVLVVGGRKSMGEKMKN
jgi:hypothetical protein